MSKEKDILKWFEGEISTEEIKKRHSEEDFSTLEKLGFYAKQIEAPKIDAQAALADFKARNLKRTKPKVVRLNFNSVLKVAAVLVVMLTSSYFLFFNTNKSFSTHIAQTEIVYLPDNSEVILNAQSKLVYNKKQWKQKRILELEGEAFFKVSKGETFTVKTEVGAIQVLGTQFNVKERINYFEVQCYEGSVQVQYNAVKTVLTPGKSFRVVNGEVSPAADFVSKNPSWLANESSFDNVPLWQVIAELQIQYNIIIVADNIDTFQKFSGSFTHTDKNIALQSVTIPLKLSYKIDGENVTFYTYEAN
ncbi:FecR family protein [Snuella sedimenti]|uniref:FecR domain-containing protein n=1 Tax=Snuella sedimenti TaxID=2798802 RepID=A0A8J7LRY6_9FLAO|nr:FecR domain-containing protein [Snuella sedimenti]MBJ6366936.1 FecR domain-containing protein [Snuella sedimenti]